MDDDDITANFDGSCDTASQSDASCDQENNRPECSECDIASYFRCTPLADATAIVSAEWVVNSCIGTGVSHREYRFSLVAKVDDFSLGDSGDSVARECALRSLKPARGRQSQLSLPPTLHAFEAR